MDVFNLRFFSFHVIQDTITNNVQISPHVRVPCVIDRSEVIDEGFQSGVLVHYYTPSSPIHQLLEHPICIRTVIKEMLSRLIAHPTEQATVIDDGFSLGSCSHLIRHKTNETFFILHAHISLALSSFILFSLMVSLAFSSDSPVPLPCHCTLQSTCNSTQLSITTLYC